MAVQQYPVQGADADDGCQPGGASSSWVASVGELKAALPQTTTMALGSPQASQVPMPFLLTMTVPAAAGAGGASHPAQAPQEQPGKQYLADAGPTMPSLRSMPETVDDGIVTENLPKLVIVGQQRAHGMGMMVVRHPLTMHLSTIANTWQCSIEDPYSLDQELERWSCKKKILERVLHPLKAICRPQAAPLPSLSLPRLGGLR